jgi:prevent-host-death family protein
MDRVSARELKNRTGDVLRRVRAGSSVLVTHRGRPVAVVAPAPADATLEEARDLAAIWRDIEDSLAASEPPAPTWQEAVRRSRRRP